MIRSPLEISQLLGSKPPTDEQAAIIAADLLHPHLVVAGAGSGKTETMANRVVYLVANGLRSPGEILGLTFTRKAAGELEQRITARLAQFGSSQERGESNLLLAELPEVSTYNAFAASVYRDHALRIGYEPDAVVISDSVAWRLAYRVVVESRDTRLGNLDLSVSRIVSAVLALAREMADHGAQPEQVRDYALSFGEHVSPLVAGIRLKSQRDKLAGYLRNISMLPLLVDLGQQYQAAKRSRGFIEFSDQVALAQRIISEHPDVAEQYRSRFTVVLLDEYQDTSVAQTRFLAELFAGSSVMAVGDPDQSIYGFRGASAANLTRFGQDFGEGEVFQLSVSWRNPHAVLDAANVIAGGLVRTGEIEKVPLHAHAATTQGRVYFEYAETVADEAERVADWMYERMHNPVADTAGNLPDAAVLLRARKHLGLFADALRARGLPVQVAGISGLLTEPVIVDLSCALAVLHDPTANAELLRLLTGARWAIGAADIEQLSLLARELASHDDQGRPLDAAARQAKRNSFEEIDTSSLVEALDAIASNTVPRADWLAGFTPAGLQRLQRAGAGLAGLRRRSSARLAELVELVIAELGLDIEAHANEAAAVASNALESFAELVADYSALADDSSLSGFLDWLEDAEARDDISPRQEPPLPATVQLMTMHRAKGLEWTYVALPRQVETEMPGSNRDGGGWMALGNLPYAFRGDGRELAQFHWRSSSDATEFVDQLDQFLHDLDEAHLQEERRLAYVAVTRPKHELLLSGSWWGGQQRPRSPGAFMAEIAAATGLDNWPNPSKLTAAPEPNTAPPSWPRDPLGARRGAVLSAQRLVEQATPGPLGDPQLQRLIDKLLAEARESDRVHVDVPTRVPASRVKDYLDDPAAAERRLARPVPQRPYAATRIGTLFHSWVEHRSSGLEIDALDAELDQSDTVQLDQLDTLKATFEASVWGALRPIDVEREIHLPLAGHVFICKIDAVYAIDAESPADPNRPANVRYQIVDWKTGAAPKTARDLELKQSQLALYRLAYASHLGIDPADIDAVFYFVADNVVLRPERLYDEAEFVSAWLASVSPGSESGSVET